VNFGVQGIDASPNGAGILGTNTAANGVAVVGKATATGVNANIGVQGIGSGSQSAGVSGIGSQYGVTGVANNGVNGTAGVSGIATASSGDTNGVYGESASTSGNGLSGNAKATSGFANGVYGQTASSGGNGVFGVNNSASGGFGVYGQANNSAGFGVAGVNTAGYGLNGFNKSTGEGISFAGPTLLIAAFNGTTGLFNLDNSGNGWFAGNLNVTGRLTKGSGSFKIDDPLDPAHKYLSHSFVESPDMKNVYDGVSVLDAHGSAWVTLPDYFEALNRDFRYQLTAIGTPAPNLYIAKKVSGNRFKIAGGKPHGEVSWQVTGIRHDAYADAYRIPVEEEKPLQEQGHYLHPELFGASEHQAIGAGMVVPSTGSAPSTRASTINLLPEAGNPAK
jgi:hypothetical protein